MNTVSQHTSPLSFFTIIPHIIRRCGLDPYEFRLYHEILAIAGQAAEQGACWMSNRNLADACNMSESKVRDVKKSLARPRPELSGRSLIKVTKRKKQETSGKDTDYITVEDVWDLNQFKKKVTCVSGTEGVRTENAGCACGTDKEDPIKNNPKKNNNRPPADAAHAVVVFSVFDELEIPADLKQRLSAKMDEAKAKKLVKRVKAWKERESDAIGCNAILKNWDSWTDPTAKEDRAEANKSWAKEHLKRYDERSVGGFTCYVLNSHVEFCGSGGVCQPKCFLYKDASFQNEVSSFIKAQSK